MAIKKKGRVFYISNEKNIINHLQKIKDIHEIRQEHKLDENFLLGWNEAIKSFQFTANQRLHRAFSDDLEIQKYINEVAKDLLK